MNWLIMKGHYETILDIGAHGDRSLALAFETQGSDDDLTVETFSIAWTKPEMYFEQEKDSSMVGHGISNYQVLCGYKTCEITFKIAFQM